MTRAFSTLVGAAIAGGLVWVAAQIERDTTGGYWAVMGILAGAGLALALARLPDTGMRTLVPSLPTFGLAFLPALVAAGWVVVALEPHGNWFRSHVLSWSGNIGVTGVVRDLGPYVTVLAFGLGVVFGLVFERRVALAVEEPAAETPADVAAAPAPADETDAESEETVVQPGDREPSRHYRELTRR
jgi:hypothetical protein